MRKLSVHIDDEPQEYEEALERQLKWVQDILDHPESSFVLNFLEHLPVLTTGRTFEKSHLLVSSENLLKKGVSLVEVSRGGSVTYHGPGQLTVYLHVHLKELGLGLTTLMRDLEQWVIDTLGSLGVDSDRAEGKTGVWTSKGKVCAMGIAAKKFVTYHGIGLNVSVDRDAFEWIVPCGLTEPVASLEQLMSPLPTREILIQALLNHLPPWLEQLERS